MRSTRCVARVLPWDPWAVSPPFNSRHLYYFWMVDKEDSMSNAAAQLDMAVQTVSTQVRELERDLGCQLRRPEVRG